MRCAWRHLAEFHFSFHSFSFWRRRRNSDALPVLDLQPPRPHPLFSPLPPPELEHQRKKETEIPLKDRPRNFKFNMQAVQDVVKQLQTSALARRIVEAHKNLDEPYRSVGYGDGGHGSSSTKQISAQHLLDALVCFAVAFCTIFAVHQIVAKRE